MFTLSQLKEFREIAENINGAQISFDRQRLLIRTNITTDEEYTVSFISIFFIGMMLFLAFVLSIIFKEVGLFGFSLVGLVGLIIVSRKLMLNRKNNSSRLPDLIFDSNVQSFFRLIKPQVLKDAPSYDQYFINSVTGVRAVILSSSEYSDDAIVQICIGVNNWITLLRVNRSAVAYELESVISLCRVGSLR